MKPNLENLKEYTKNVSLSSGEKFDMFENIRNYSNNNPVRSRYSVFMKHSIAYASMFALLIGTSATSYAAERSLPGDILYPVKTNINEEVAKTLSVTKKQKAKTNVKLVEKRMSELTEMVVKEKDSPEKIDIIVQKLEEHREELEDYIEDIEENNTENSDDATEIYAELESVVESHLDILEEIKEDEETESALNIALTALATTSRATSTAQVTTTTDVTIQINTEGNKASTTNNTSTATDTDNVITGEEDAVNEITNFSSKIGPLLDSVKAKTQQNIATTTKIKDEVRKKIIEDTERKLQIDLDEEVNSDIEL